MTRCAEQNQEILFWLSIQSSSHDRGWERCRWREKRGRGREKQNIQPSTYFLQLRVLHHCHDCKQIKQSGVGKETRQQEEQLQRTARVLFLTKTNSIFIMIIVSVRSDLKWKSSGEFSGDFHDLSTWMMNTMHRLGKERNETSSRWGAKTFQCRSNWLAAF